jgi:gas vesicle protein
MILFMLSLTVLYCLKKNKQKKSENPVQLVFYQKDEIKSIIDEINEKNNRNNHTYKYR